MNCIRCTSTTLHKNGILPSGGQRWRCFDCDKQFSVGGKRGTYTETFKADVIDEYCHSDKTARQVVADHHISSATLIKWKKEHTGDCDICHNQDSISKTQNRPINSSYCNIENRSES